LATVGMTANMNRAIRGYSKGMRQRTKLAQALVHNPRVLFLDEPFTGTDPLGRHEMIEVIRGLGAAGHTILVSSHVLHEVRSLTPNIVLLHRGRLVAQGHVRQIRDLIDGHPHRIVLVCDDFRGLAARWSPGRTWRASSCWTAKAPCWWRRASRIPFMAGCRRW